MFCHSFHRIEKIKIRATPHGIGLILTCESVAQRVDVDLYPETGIAYHEPGTPETIDSQRKLLRQMRAGIDATLATLGGNSGDALARQMFADGFNTPPLALALDVMTNAISANASTHAKEMHDLVDELRSLAAQEGGADVQG